MTPRKQRRKLQMERVRKGLPPAKPWDYAKERRLHKISEMIAQADQRLAVDLGISSELVSKIRDRLVNTVTTPVALSKSGASDQSRSELPVERT